MTETNTESGTQGEYTGDQTAGSDGCCGSPPEPATGPCCDTAGGQPAMTRWCSAVTVARTDRNAPCCQATEWLSQSPAK